MCELLDALEMVRDMPLPGAIVVAAALLGAAWVASAFIRSVLTW